jgi:hypothetical protein
MCYAGGMNCPSTAGIIGDNMTCKAIENNEPCSSCNYVVTDPAGKRFTGRTGKDGSFNVPMSIEGTYTIELLKAGSVMKTIEIPAFPRVQPIQENPLNVLDLVSKNLLGLVILAIALAALLLYWRSRKGKRPGKR